MFGFLKTLLHKRSNGQVENQEAAEAAPEATHIFEAEPTSVSAESGEGAPVQRNAGLNSKGVELPLQVILGGLPLELQSRVQQTLVGEAYIFVPVEKILSQLARGSVKISFGELRAGAPELFSSDSDSDRVLVPLPLGEILSRLNPALITRRRAQKQIEVPAHISSPFDSRGQGLAFSDSPAKAPAPAPVAPPIPVAAPVPAARPSPVARPTPIARPQPAPAARPIPAAQPISAPRPTPMAQP